MPELIYIPYHKRYISKEDLVSKIATYLFVEASHETSTGNWCITDEEITDFFQLPDLSIVHQLKDAIIAELLDEYNDMVESVDTYMDGDMLTFDINLWHHAIYGLIEDDACFYVPEN